MAARKKDAWLEQVEAGVSPALLGSLFETSGPGLEARLSALLRQPREKAIADAAADFFVRFPVKFREQLSCAAVAAGLAVVHGTKAPALAKARPPKAPNEAIPSWHGHVTTALRKVLGGASKAPTGKGDASPLTEQKRADLQAAWLKRAEPRHPDALPALLARFSDGPATDVTVRAVALLDFARDARIADAAAEFLRRPTVRVSAEQPIFTVLALVLVVHGDRSHRKTAEALSSKIPALAWLERVLPDVDAAPRTQSRSAADGPRDEASFLRFIAEQPADDGRVAAFTDWLLERAEPRGEFCSLQRAGRALTPKEAARVAALQKKHEKVWLRSLARARLKDSVVFRGGLLRELALGIWKGGDLPADGEPLLPVLQKLAVTGGTNLPELKTLFSDSSRFTSLRGLTAPAWILEGASATLMAQLTSVGVVEPQLGIKGPRLSVIARASMPKVRELVLRGQWWAEVAEVQALPQFGQLERLCVDTTKPELWLPLTRKLARVELRPYGQPPQVYENGKLQS